MIDSNEALKYIIVYPESHQHLGLFDDLNTVQQVKAMIVTPKKIRNPFLRGLRKIHTSWTINNRINLPFKNIWYKNLKIEIEKKSNYCVIFIDIAINHIREKELKYLCSLPNVRCVLVCINSIDASSVGMIQIRNKIFRIPWHDVYTFDPGDKEKYGLKSVVNCYYSYHDISQEEIKNDVFFVGGLKGNRARLVFELFDYLMNHDVKCCFWISARKEEMLHNPPFQDKINYYTGGWRPYTDILKCNMESNVIIEILQENQEGPSLRYYEAVCYNKKLITTNKRVLNLPYYNHKFMKIIEKPEDIDIDWIKRRDVVDYGYKGDFSPVNMLDVVVK